MVYCSKYRGSFQYEKNRGSPMAERWENPMFLQTYTLIASD